MDYDWEQSPEALTEARRRSISRTIREIGIDELRTLGEQLFTDFGHPWREPFFLFLEENRGERFFHAEAPDNAEVIYCPAKHRGLWFIRGTGIGPLQPKGLRLLAEVLKNR